eukprot:5048206-Pleurochrysis_carterae.AAC.3
MPSARTAHAAGARGSHAGLTSPPRAAAGAPPPCSEKLNLCAAILADSVASKPFASTPRLPLLVLRCCCCCCSCLSARLRSRKRRSRTCRMRCSTLNGSSSPVSSNKRAKLSSSGRAPCAISRSMMRTSNAGSTARVRAS